MSIDLIMVRMKIFWKQIVYMKYLQCNLSLGTIA